MLRLTAKRYYLYDFGRGDKRYKPLSLDTQVYMWPGTTKTDQPELALVNTQFLKELDL